MGDLWVNVLVVLFFILLGGFFAAAELALVSLRESQVQRLAEEHRRGRRLAQLTADPNRFLAAGQVAVTLAGFISAGFGASQIAPQLSPLFVSWGMSQGVADTLAFIVITIVIAYVSLVLGELVPKRIALQRVEPVALAVTRPVDVIARIFRPFIWALSVATDAIVRLLGMDPHAGKEAISGEELRDLVATHEALSVEERTLIDDVFSAGERELREVMLPRTEVDFLPASLPLREAATVVTDKPHSRYPVMGDSSDDVVGFVHIRDIFDPSRSGSDVTIGDVAREVTAFPGTKEVLTTLTEMRRLRQHLAIVQDEYGGTAGIVTLEDLVEELIGDVQDEYDLAGADAAVPVSGEIVVGGLTNVSDFADDTGIELPDGPYETIAGFVVAQLGRVPTLGDGVELVGHTFEVTELDGLRISQVVVRPVASPSDGGGQDVADDGPQ